MRTAATNRECPYCGASFRLELCRVVSKPGEGTGLDSAVHSASVHSAGTDPGDRDDGLSDTTTPTARVLYDPATQSSAPQPAPSARGWLGWGAGGRASDVRLRPLSSFDPALLPRRECPSCEMTLPVYIDEMPSRIVSIVGLQIAGKSNYLGTALHLARSGGLEDYGVTDFSADPDTATTFHEKYYLPLFRRNEALDATLKDWRVGHKPLSFSVTMNDRKFLLVTHDVAGELLVNHDQRAVAAGFVRRSMGVVFMLDPTEFDQLRVQLPPDQLEVDRPIDQAELLAQVLTELAHVNVPVAIAIAKSDLLATVCRGATFLDNRQGPVTAQDLQTVSDEVKRLLVSIGQKKIVDIAEAYGRCTFHAVSSLGTDRVRVNTQGVRPVRVLEPLGVVLRRVSSWAT